MSYERYLKKKVLFSVAPYLFIIAISISVFSPYIVTGNGYFNWGDISYPFFPARSLTNDYYIWDQHNAPGRWPTFQGAMPYKGLVLVLESIAPPTAVNHFMILLPYLLMGSGSYFLISLLTRTGSSDSDRINIPALVGACFSLLNPVMIWWDPLVGIALGTVPIVLGLFIRYMQTRHYRYIPAISAISIMMAFSVPVFLLGISFIIGYFVVRKVILIEKITVGELKAIALLGGATILANSFWLVPLLYSAGIIDLVDESTNPTYGAAQGLIEQNAFRSSFENSIRLIFPFQPWAEYYLNVVTTLAVISPLVLAFALVTAKKASAELKVFFVFAVVLVLLSANFEFLSDFSFFESLRGFLPFFGVIRDVYFFFYFLMIVYAMLLGLSGSFLLKSVARLDAKTIVTAILSLIIIINAGVVFLSPVDQHWPTHASDMRIPQDYYKLESLLTRTEPDSYAVSMMVLPWQDKNVTYKWYDVDKPAMTDIIHDFSPIRIAGIQVGSKPEGLNNLVVRSLEGGKHDDAVRLMALAGIKYIFVHNDIRIDNLPYAEAVDYAAKVEFYLQRLSERPDLFREIEGFDSFRLFTIGDRSQPIVKSMLLGDFRPVTLDGRSGYLVSHATDKASINPPFSIVVWIKQLPAELNAGGFLLANSAIEENGEPSYFFFMNSNDTPGNIQFSLNGHTVLGPIGVEPVVVNGEYEVGQWHMITVSASDTTLNLYVDGKLADSKRLTGTLRAYNGDTKLFIGHRDHPVQNSTFVGQISGVSIYGRDLASEEIRRMYDGGLASNDFDPVAPSLKINTVLGRADADSLPYDIIGNVDWDKADYVKPLEAVFIASQPAFIEPTRFLVQASSETEFALLLNDRFDENWVAMEDGRRIEAHSNYFGQNMWVMEAGDHDVEIFFKPQEIVLPSMVFSITSYFTYLLVLKKAYHRLWIRR